MVGLLLPQVVSFVQRTRLEWEVARLEAERKLEETRQRQEEERRQWSSEMVVVPKGIGRFFGKCTKDGAECDNGEESGRPVYVAAFKIDKTEVTVSAYQRCVDAGRCKRPGAGGDCNWNKTERGNPPINCVYSDKAETYCRWAGKRLPTDLEWQKAARGADGRMFPWGNEWDARNLNWYWNHGGYKGTSPVGFFPAGASPYGVLDMAGNVREWVVDEKSRRHFVRGGSWEDTGEQDHLFFRLDTGIRTFPGSVTATLGFQCASSTLETEG